MDCTFAFERMHAGCDVHHKTLVGVAFSVGMQPWSCRKWCSTFPCFLVCWMTEWMHSAIPQLKNFLNHNVWDNLAACLTRHFNVPSMSPVPTSTMFGIVAKTPAAERAKKCAARDPASHPQPWHMVDISIMKRLPTIKVASASLRLRFV